MKSKRLIGLILAILLLTSATVYATPAKQVVELKIAIHTDEGTLTPFTFVRGYPGIEVMRLIFDSLFILDEKNQVQPWMVDSYQVNDAFTEYRLVLKPDQFWHDGKPLSAEDVAFSFTYPLTQSSSRWRRIANQVQKIDVADALNLTIFLKAANPDFISLSLTDMAIIPKHVYDGIEDAKTVKETVGSGPYKLVEYKESQHYIFEAVDGYFKGNARVARLVMPVMADTTTIFQALRAGSIHATTANVAPEVVSSFEADKSIAIAAGPGLATTLLQINNEVYPFTRTEVRKALALAVDTKELVDVILLQYGDRGSLGFFHPAGLNGNNSLVWERDAEKANQLLDKLGFTWQGSVRLDDHGQPLIFELLVSASNPLRIRTAEIIAEQVRDIGIELKIVSLEPNTLDELVWPGFDVSQGRNYYLSIWGWSAPTQLRPDALVQLASSDYALGTLNIGAFKNTAFDSLAARYTAELNPDVRKDMIHEMQEMAASEIPMIPLYYPHVIMAYRSDIYDGWVLQQGNGIMNKMSFLPGYAQEVQTPAQPDAGQKSSMMPYYLIFVLLLAGIIIIRRRKAGNGS